MGFPRAGKCLLRALLLVSIYQIETGYGVTVYRKRFGGLIVAQ